VERGAFILPHGSDEASAVELARARGALLAGRRGDGYSLSPRSLVQIAAGTRLVLPSPNGSAICVRASRYGKVLAGSLRNRSAIAARATALGGPFAVIAAGERWPDGTLRPALEDLAGAGAIAACLPGSRSPEALAAIAAWEAIGQPGQALAACASGRELLERGFGEDVELAAALDADRRGTELLDGMFGAR
jgi:2-phosphosulfolactate phosphatase